MGFMDKVKDTVKDVDNKIGESIDKSKLDSQIRDEERLIEKATMEIGQRVLEAIDNGKTIADIDVSDICEKIKVSRDRIAEYKEKREAI